MRRSKLGKIRLVSDGDKNKVRASTAERDKNKEQSSNRFGWYLDAALSARSPFWLVSGDHLNQPLKEIKIKSNHQTDLAGTLM